MSKKEKFIKLFKDWISEVEFSGFIEDSTDEDCGGEDWNLSINNYKDIIYIVDNLNEKCFETAEALLNEINHNEELKNTEVENDADRSWLGPETDAECIERFMGISSFDKDEEKVEIIVKFLSTL